jgi:hypothetical protein
MEPGGNADQWKAQVRRFRLGEVTTVGVLDLLRGMEVRVPVLPGAGPAACLLSPDPARPLRALPVFTSEAALSRWRPGVRGVVTDVAGMALAAHGAGTGYVLVDPGGAGQFSLRPRMLEALAAGTGWEPPWNDRRVAQAVRDGVVLFPSIVDVHLQAGDPTGALRGPEVLVVLDVLTGPDAGELAELSTQLLAGWEGDHRIRDRVDSLGVRYHEIRPC